jgi:hypothetical protein
VHEVKHAVMGAPEPVLREHGVRVAREIAIGEKEQLDVRDEIVTLAARFPRTRRAGVGCGRGPPAAERLSSYVSHVDIFVDD